MAHLTFVSLWNGPLIDGKLALVEVFNAALLAVVEKQMASAACVRRRKVERWKRQTERKRGVLFNRSGV